MRKIPTLFVRNPQTHKIEPVLSDGCDWVLRNEGRATRKLDGTAVLLRNGRAYKRREVKPRQAPPAHFEHLETDTTTGKMLGWVPIHPTAPSDQYFVEAIRRTEIRILPPNGETYELLGPKVQRNTENLDQHTLIAHNSEQLLIAQPPPIASRDAASAFDILKAYLADYPHEGIVWHHPDGRRAKIKRRDFGHPWPLHHEARGSRR